MFCLPSRNVARRLAAMVCQLSFSLFLFLAINFSPQTTSAQCNQLEIPGNGMDEDCDQLDGLFLHLPPHVYMVAGQDFELYFRNCILSTHPDDYQFSVITPLYGTKTNEKWSFTPTPEQVGTHPLTLQVKYRSGQVLESKETTVRISPAPAPADMSPRKVLLWGHSFFDHGYLPIYLSDLTLQAGKNPPFQWLGKNANWLGGPVRFEAKGGTTWSYYFETPQSPFFYDGQLNMRRYFDEVQCAGCAPDWIVVYLDINDYLFSAQLDGASLARIDEQIDQVYQQKTAPMLAAVRAAAPNAKIAYCMAPAACGHAGAFLQTFGPNVLGDRYRWQKIVNRLLFKTTQLLSGREAEGIYLVPTGLDLDVFNEYNTFDAIHPHLVNGQLAGPSGYREIAKSIYAWMKYAMNTSSAPPSPPVPTDPQAHCASRADFPWEEWISAVEVGAAGRASGKSQDNNFTATVFPLAANTATPVRLTATFSYWATDEHWKIWIDFNRNGVFEEPSEVAFQSKMPAPQSGLGIKKTISGLLNVPPGTAAGPARMRVSMRSDGWPGPCDAFDRGETEDYTANIAGSLILPDPMAQQREQPAAPETALEVGIFPNPSQGLFTLAPVHAAQRPLHIEVRNAFGQALFGKTVAPQPEPGAVQLDLNGQPDGAYLVKVWAEGERAVFRWAIKNAQKN